MGNRSLYLPNPGVIGVYSEKAASWLGNGNQDPLEDYIYDSTGRYWKDSGRSEVKDWYKNDGSPTKDNTVSLYQYIRYRISKELDKGGLIETVISKLKSDIDTKLAQNYYTIKEIDGKGYATKTWVENNFVAIPKT